MSSNVANRAGKQALQLSARRYAKVSTSVRGKYGHGQCFATAAGNLHSFALRRMDDEQDNNKRSFHSTPPSDRAVALLMGLGTVSALAYAGSSAIQSFQAWKAAQPSAEEVEEARKVAEEERKKEEAKMEEEAKAAEKEAADKPRENIFKQFFDVGTKYYEGGFEDTMTKREAALILGVRESASPKRIKDAHRKLLILNHPDTGGSTYISGKINEAKELLLKGKARV